MNSIDFEDAVYEKIRILNETLWENKVNKIRIERWLQNFNTEDEKLHALFLLSQFMYFGSLQMRELLKGLYRDLYKYRVIEKIRILNNDTVDQVFLEKSFSEALSKTRFLGVGNPSESGTHLLYFFRQENKLPKKLFIDSQEIIDRQDPNNIKLLDPSIKEYVFFDDFCGTGSQAKMYSKRIISEIKSIDPNVKVSYLMLFATKRGKEFIRTKTLFDYVETIFEFDDSFRCFGDESRYFHDDDPKFIQKSFAESVCGAAGLNMMKEDKNKLGFGDCQLLVGFYHNTPDNTLPIFWWDEQSPKWYPIFKRYNKIYG